MPISCCKKHSKVKHKVRLLSICVLQPTLMRSTGWSMEQLRIADSSERANFASCRGGKKKRKASAFQRLTAFKPLPYFPETAHRRQTLCWSESAQQQLKINKILVRFRAAAVVFLSGQQWNSRVVSIWWCGLRKPCKTKHRLHAVC